MYKYLAATAFILAAYAPSQLSAVNLILATQHGNCTLELAVGSNVNVDPSSGNVLATIAQGSTCPEISGNATLTVTRNGTGTGTVTSTPSGISCGSTCSASFPAGQSVTLNAAAGANSAFAGWAGDCTGTGICQVSMTQARNVTATFNAAVTFPLTVSKTGSGTGTVTSTPSGINCGPTCSSNFIENTTVTLTATAGGSSTFTGWSGETCTGTGSCQVTMSQARSVSANFDPVGGGQCAGVGPEGFSRVTGNVSITIGNSTMNVNATRLSSVFRTSTGTEVNWPGNPTTRYLRIPRNGYVGMEFVPDVLGQWVVANYEHLENPILPLMYSVSTCPGDYRTTPDSTVPMPDRCIVSGNETQLQFDVVTSIAGYSGTRCPLQQGVTYYLNMMIPDCPDPRQTCSSFVRSYRP